jgi:hypothetical protein
MAAIICCIALLQYAASCCDHQWLKCTALEPALITVVLFYCLQNDEGTIDYQDAADAGEAVPRLGGFVRRTSCKCSCIVCTGTAQYTINGIQLQAAPVLG